MYEPRLTTKSSNRGTFWILPVTDTTAWSTNWLILPRLLLTVRLPLLPLRSPLLPWLLCRVSAASCHCVCVRLHAAVCVCWNDDAAGICAAFAVKCLV